MQAVQEINTEHEYLSEMYRVRNAMLWRFPFMEEYPQGTFELRYLMKYGNTTLQIAISNACVIITSGEDTRRIFMYGIYCYNPEKVTEAVAQYLAQQYNMTGEYGV